MFSQEFLHNLQQHSTTPRVSVFVPTSAFGPETQRAAVHLGNLLKDAESMLADHGLSTTEAEALLAPLSDKVADRDFWQHQSEGLALFASGSGSIELSVSHTVTPQAIVGDVFDVLPLLPGLATEGEYLLVCASQGAVSVYRAGATSMQPVEVADLPASLDDVIGDADYENPVLASPPSRPNTGTHNMSNAQVYGDAPPEWQAKVRRTFAERIAGAIRAAGDLSPLPLVLIADEKLAGDLSDSLGAAATDTAHPDSLTDKERHERSWAMAQPLLDQGRAKTLELMAQRLGQGEAVATDPAEVAVVASEGRVETLFVSRDTPDHTVSTALWATLAHGGNIVWAGDADAPPETGVAALLRY